MSPPGTTPTSWDVRCLTGFGSKPDIGSSLPNRRGRRLRRPPVSSTRSNSLSVCCFDGVPPGCLGCLVAQRREVCPGLRLVKSQRLFQAIPFGEDHASGGRRPVDWNNLATTSAKRAATSGLLCSRGSLSEFGLGRSIERLGFSYSVSFGLGLRVQALDRDGANCDAREHC